MPVVNTCENITMHAKDMAPRNPLGVIIANYVWLL